MPTPEELAYDAAAFRAYTRAMLESMGWMGKIAELQIPETAWIAGAVAVVTAANAAKDQSVAGRQAAGAAALRTGLDATGNGARVTDDEVNKGVAAILYADNTWRVQHPRPAPPAPPPSS